ncbi:MAG: DUF2400 domain-containing protein [Leptospiraceae bacterium]|nr:DUF2400 domain-containing protein [Leptospiraceae bacterium]
MQKSRRLKAALESLHSRYNRQEYLASDPLSLVLDHTSKRPKDVEVIALLCALFAYGRVASIKDFPVRLLQWLGSKPHDALIELHAKKRVLPGADLYYRFQSCRDMETILYRLGAMLADSNRIPVPGNPESKGSRFLPLERYFASGVPEEITSVSYDNGRRAGLPGIDAMISFQSAFLSGIPESLQTDGIVHWIGRPEGKGARKRLSMFLRWMVRKDYPDLGLYRCLDPAELTVPLDVHLGRIARNLGFSARKGADSTMAVEVSMALSGLWPADPLKYDFALTRPGILGRCTGSFQESACPSCILRRVCAQWANGPTTSSETSVH